MGNILLIKDREIASMREENDKLYKEKTILENMLLKIPADVVEMYCN